MKEKGAVGRIVCVKAQRCERAWIIWGKEKGWAWLGCQRSGGNSRRYDY